MLLFWDIDGTLLTTGRAGIYALQDALAEVTGVRADLFDFDTAGYPDHGIARRLLQEVARVPADEARVQALVGRYEALLPGALPRRTGRVLPNVRAILERLRGEPGVRSLLLTGNTRRGAAAKLAHYGLAHLLEDGGAFSDDAADRDGIARAAWARVGQAAELAETWVIGDTPLDVRCGRAIGARTLAVATGAYSREALDACGPDVALEVLPEPEAFLALVRGSAAGERGARG